MLSLKQARLLGHLENTMSGGTEREASILVLTS